MTMIFRNAICKRGKGTREKYYPPANAFYHRHLYDYWTVNFALIGQLQKCFIFRFVLDKPKKFKVMS